MVTGARRAGRDGRQPAGRARCPTAPTLSDRTGRRHVWTLGGALLGAAALVLLAQQRTIVGVALGWVAAQVCFNAMLAALTAAVPDRVPVRQRGGGLRLGGHPAGARRGPRRRCW